LEDWAALLELAVADCPVLDGTLVQSSGVSGGRKLF